MRCPQVRKHLSVTTLRVRNRETESKMDPDSVLAAIYLLAIRRLVLSF